MDVPKGAYVRLKNPYSGIAAGCEGWTLHDVFHPIPGSLVSVQFTGRELPVKLFFWRLAVLRPPGGDPDGF